MERQRRIAFGDQEERIFNETRDLVLAEDAIKRLRPVAREYSTALRNHIREAMQRGFDRSLVEYSLRMFTVEIGNLILVAEQALNGTNYSYKSNAEILRSELQALKKSIAVFLKTTEEMVLKEPDVGNQMFLNGKRRTR